MAKKNTKSKEPTFILNGNPTKSGTYKVLYTRAKSTEVREGKATFKTRKSSYYNKGWNDVIGVSGAFLWGGRNGSGDYRHPKVIGWALTE